MTPYVAALVIVVTSVLSLTFGLWWPTRAWWGVQFLLGGAYASAWFVLLMNIN